MFASRKHFIVRICPPDSRVPVGMGVVVGDRHVVTCAHVVNAALGRDPRNPADPGSTVTVKVEFLLQEASAPVPVNCRVESWSAPPGSGIAGGDIAGLVTIDGPIPSEARPARMLDSAAEWNMSASVFGHPQESGRKRPAGGWARVFIAGVVGGGLIQLDAVSGGAFRAQPGYSGSPVVIADAAGDAVVGILSAASPGSESRDSYAIPVPHIVRQWPEVLRVADVAGTPPVSRRVPAFKVKPLPDNFEPRPQLFAEVRETLLRLGAVRPVRLIGLVGMGGAGKSVLARALAHDVSVRQAFRDGLVWLDLGESAEPAARQTDLSEEFGDHRAAVDWKQRLTRLNTLLAGASCLVILDDVWEREHLRPFELQAPDSALLVTTRRRDVLIPSAVVHQVGVLPTGSATKLLAAWARQPPAGLPRDAQRVANLCAGLPLALTVAGAMVAVGYSWRHVSLRMEQADLRKLQFNLSDYQQYDNLFRVMDASVGCLPDRERECYLDLAVFEGRGEVPAEVAFLLWGAAGLSELDCEDLLLLLERRSLLQRNPMVGTFTLHSLQFAYARGQRGPQGLRDLHARLAAIILGRWSGPEEGPPDLPANPLEAPADRYGVLNLVAHLNGAGAEDDIHRLLALDADATGGPGQPVPVKNAWYAVHERIGATASYAADVQLAWDLARTRGDIGLEIRYALISASIASLAASIPAALITALVSGGQWTAGQGFRHARKLPDAAARARTLADLISHCQEGPGAAAGPAGGLEQDPLPELSDMLAEALAAVRMIDDPAERASVLTSLAARWAGPDRKALIAEAWDAVLAVPRKDTQARVLAALASAGLTLPKKIRDHAFGLARKAPDAGLKACLLTALASQLPTSERGTAISEAQTEAEKMPTGRARAHVYTGLAARLSGPAREAGLSRARSEIGFVDRPEDRAALLTGLLRLLPSARRADSEVATAALNAIALMGSPEEQAAAATAVIHQFPAARRTGHIGRTLDVAALIGEVRARATALIALVSLAPEAEPLQDRALRCIAEISDPADRAAARTALGRQLTPGDRRAALLNLALAEACAVQDTVARAAAIARLLDCLPGWDVPAAALDGRRAVHQTITDVRAWGRPELTVATWAALAPAMPEAERRQAIKQAKIEADKIDAPAGRGAALTALLPLLDEPDHAEFLARACVAASVATEPEERDAALAALLTVAPDALIQQAADVTGAAEAVTRRLTDLVSELAVSRSESGERQAWLSVLLTTPATAQPADGPGLLPPEHRAVIADRAKSAATAVGRLQAAAAALAAMTAVDPPGPDNASRQPTRVRAVGRARAAVHILHRQMSELGENVGDTVLPAIRAVDDAQLRLDGELPLTEVSHSSRPQDTIPSPQTQADQCVSWKAHWRAVIQDVAPDGRAALLAALSDLGPVIARDGGTAAGQETVQALLDAGRWWP